MLFRGTLFCSTLFEKNKYFVDLFYIMLQLSEEYIASTSNPGRSTQK